MFAVKGAVAGLFVALAVLLGMDGRPGGLDTAALLLALPAVAAWCAMNFTGFHDLHLPFGGRAGDAAHYSPAGNGPAGGRSLLGGGSIF